MTHRGATYIDEGGFEREYTEPLVALIQEARAQRRRHYERDADRGYAAMTLTPTVTIARALYRGRPVPREALDPVFRDRLICWDGVLTDEIVLDVLVLLEADRLAGDIPTADAPAFTTRSRAA